MKVRCNECMSIFDEVYIDQNSYDGDEYCPCCGRIGALMDVSESEFPQYYNHEPKEN